MASPRSPRGRGLTFFTAHREKALSKCDPDSVLGESMSPVLEETVTAL